MHVYVHVCILYTSVQLGEPPVCMAFWPQLLVVASTTADLNMALSLSISLTSLCKWEKSFKRWEFNLRGGRFSPKLLSNAAKQPRRLSWVYQANLASAMCDNSNSPPLFLSPQSRRETTPRMDPILYLVHLV